MAVYHRCCSSGAERRPAKRTSNMSRGQGGKNPPSHDEHCKCRPRHRSHKRNVDWREEKAAVEIARHQAQRDRRQPCPSSHRKTPDGKEGGHSAKPDEEGHGMADGDPVGEIERLDIGRKNVKPWAVIPERKFDAVEMRAVGESTCVPGESLWTVINT